MVRSKGLKITEIPEVEFSTQRIFEWNGDYIKVTIECSARPEKVADILQNIANWRPI